MAEGGKSLDKVPSYERQNTEDIEDLPLKIPVSSRGHYYSMFTTPIKAHQHTNDFLYEFIC